MCCVYIECLAIGSREGLFSVARETEPNWDADIRDDVYEECGKFGGVIHIYVDKLSQVCGKRLVYPYCQLLPFLFRLIFLKIFLSRVTCMSSVLMRRLRLMLQTH